MYRTLTEENRNSSQWEKKRRRNRNTVDFQNNSPRWLYTLAFQRTLNNAIRAWTRGSRGNVRCHVILRFPWFYERERSYNKAGLPNDQPWISVCRLRCMTGWRVRYLTGPRKLHFPLLHFRSRRNKRGRDCRANVALVTARPVTAVSPFIS